MNMIYLILLIYSISIIELYSQNQKYQELINKINKDSLYLYIEELSGDKKVVIDGELVTLNRINSKGNSNVAKYLYNRLLKFGYKPEILKYENKEYDVENVICTINGSNKTNEKFIIGAHYDSISNSGFAPGADDNATGCAVVLELARILKDNVQDNTIVFAFWDAEELGMIGSWLYSNKAKENNMNIKLKINLDMIGYDPNNDNRIKLITNNEEKNKNIWYKAQELNEIYSINLNLEFLIKDWASDVSPFWLNGYSGISFFPSIINPNYHKETDKIEFLNFDFLTLNAKLAAILLLESVNESEKSNIFNIDNNKILIIYPNPGNDFISIKIKDANILEKSNKIQIFNILGVELTQESRITRNTKIDISTLQDGVYFLKIGNRIMNFVKSSK